MTVTASRQQRLSRYQWLALALLPVFTIIVPALLGHPPILGDNATQNVSLRWLVAQNYRHGHLPIWDPFNWDGTPLLAGFNAGALFPFIVLFVVLSAPAAMTLTLALSWLFAEVFVAKIGEALGLSRWFAIAAGVVFVGSGAFTSQVVHIDMIEGDLASLGAIYCLIRLLEHTDRRQQILWTAGLAFGFACAVFAGAPEAMLASLVALGVLFLTRLAYRSVSLRTVILVAVAAVLALALAAPQWIPGLAYTTISNRAHLPPQYAGFGPYGYRFLPLILFPFAYGGYSGGYLPNYFGNYNPSEITISITSVGLVFALIAIATRGLPTMKPWAKTFLVTLMIVAAVLALGSDTPLAVLIYHLPLFNLQRLASRYIIDVDLAGVLLAAGGAEYFWNNANPRHLTPVTIRLLQLLGIITVTVGVTIIVAPTFFFRLVHATSIPTGTALLEIRLYVAVELIVMLGVVGIVLWYQRTRRTTLPTTTARGSRAPSVRLLRRIFVGALVFNLVGMATQFVVLPAFYEPSGNAAAPAASQLVQGSQRYGLYDPNLYLYTRAIVADEQLDRNVFTGTNSIQGYASLSLAGYNNLTHTKTQSTLDPALIARYHHLLNMDLLITSRHYFRFPVTDLAPGALSHQAHRPILSSQRPSSFFVGNIRGATSLRIYLGKSNRRFTVTAGTTNGATVTYRAVRTVKGWIAVPLPSGITRALLSTVTIRPIQPLSHAQRIDMVVAAGSAQLQIAGPLINNLNPKNWRSLQGKFSSLDFLSRNPTSGFLHPNAHATILSQSQASDGTLRAQISAKAPTLIDTTLAYAPGWSAHTTAGTPLRLLDDRGLITISVPRGAESIILAYQAPHLGLSFVIGAIALLGLAGLMLFGLTSRRAAI
ncbi:MAG: hypothetical protein ACYCTG_01515 [Ferrimicrobium sp.]